MEQVIIEKATAVDHSILTKMTFESKAFWGYSKEQLEKWKVDLTITPEYITQNHVYKLVLNSKTIGFYSFIQTAEDQIILDYLFVLPDFIGKGFGKNLLEHFLKRAENLNIKSITLEADPNAEAFYKKFGFTTFGLKESSVPDRFLPEMRFDLK